MRTPDGKPAAPEVFQAALKTILDGCKKLGIPAGIHTFSPDEAKQKIAEGWQFIAINSELKFMVDAAKRSLDAITGQASGGTQ